VAFSLDLRRSKHLHLGTIPSAVPLYHSIGAALESVGWKKLKGGAFVPADRVGAHPHG
jgi:hypothetical protein